MKKKVCFVIQRYGLEVNGGAEYECRQYAERLSTDYDVEVITTKAIDYVTWKNEYVADVEQINGITVHRFPVEQQRNLRKFNRLVSDFEEKVLGNQKKEIQFLKAQGPYCPKLVEEIVKRKDQYHVFIFFTYLYYTTIFGIKDVFQKAILVPTAHDEPYIHMSILKDVFQKPRAIFYNTDLEKEMVESIYKNRTIPNAIGGVGISINVETHVDAFKIKHDLSQYIVYVGRVDEGKRCGELLREFEQYKRDYQTDLKLVLVGKTSLSIPKNPDIVVLGFVSEEEKFDAIAGAMALVLPSQHESLSIVVLEAMKLQVPVLVYGKCAVTKNHCLKSNAGLYYTNYLEFEECLEYLSKHPEVRKRMGENGKSYVDENYSWEIICSRLEELIEAAGDA